MSINLYDDAVSKKIESWLPKANGKTIKVLQPDQTQQLFQMELDEAKDEPLSLPLVALSRDNTIELLQKTMTPMSFDGLMLDSNGKKTLQLDGIPIAISYQLDVYTRYQKEAYAILRELVFRLVNNPQIVIELPYNNQNFKHVATIRMQAQIEDTSAISERIVPGQFSRWTFRLDIDGAYLFNLPYVDNVSIESVELDVKQNDEGRYERE